MKKKVDVILLILSCEKNKKKLEKLLKQKWFKNLEKDTSFEIIIALGGYKKVFKKDNFLYLKTPEKMVNLSKKILESFVFIKKNYDFNFLIKCDDDIKIKNFEKILELFKKHDYSGIIRKTNKQRATLWAHKNNLKIDINKHVEVDYAVGTMFCLSEKAFKKIILELPPLVDYHTKYLGGNNDTLIGKAFEKSLKKKNFTKSQEKEINFFKKNIIEKFDFKKLKLSYIIKRLKFFIKQSKN